MSKKTSKKAVVPNVEIPKEVFTEFKRIVKAKGQTLRFVVRELVSNYNNKEREVLDL